MSLSDDNQSDIISAFKSSSRYLDGLLYLLLLPVDSLLQLIEDYAMHDEAHGERSSSSRILS